MSARLLAQFCLIHFGVSLGWTGSIGSATTTLVVYVKGGSEQPSGTIDQMRRELGALMKPAGYRLEWRDPETPDRNSAVADLVVVEFQGICGAPAITPSVRPAGSPASNIESLASTAAVDGHVLPFSTVNCGNLSAMLFPALVAERASHRDYLYGRAMARLLAHELYHVMANTRDHGHSGIAKPAFTLRDLLADHFDFDENALEKIEHRGADVVEAPAGR